MGNFKKFSNRKKKVKIYNLIKICIYRFDWAKNKKIPTRRQTKTIIKATSSGKAQIIFMWWDLNMDEEGDIKISCAPVWEHPDCKGNDCENNFYLLLKIDILLK